MTPEESARAYRRQIVMELEVRQARNPQYNQSALARDIGLRPNRLSEILKGKQGMSRQVAGRVATKLALPPEEAEQFCNLVSLAHGRSDRERELARQRLEVKRAGGATLSNDRFRAVADWYFFAILELLKVPGCYNEAVIAERLGLRRKICRDALARMIKLGLIREVDGRFEGLDDQVVGDDLPSAAIRSFHRAYLNKAADAITTQPVAERFFNTLVLGIKRRDLSQIQERIEAFATALKEEFGVEEPDSVFAHLGHFFRIDRDGREKEL